MNTKNLLFSCLLLSFLMSACSPQGTSPNPGGSGGLGMTVQDSRRPAGLASTIPLPKIMEVTSFRVVITGDGITTPIEAFFPGDATEGMIHNVPPGKNRTVLVEAVNASGEAVRRRKIEKVSVDGGRETPIVAALLTVPIVTNLSNGNLVTQSRLMFQGYSEPGGMIEVSDEFQGETISLFDEATASESVSPDLKDGSFRFVPKKLPLGRHRFTLKDPQSGEVREVTVTLVPPGREPGMGFHASGEMSEGIGYATGSGDGFSEVLEEVRK